MPLSNEHNAKMAMRIPRRLFRSAVIMLAGLLVLAGSGLIWRGEKILWRSSRSQWDLNLRFPMVQITYTTSDDPAVFPSLWNGSWTKLVDGNTAHITQDWGTIWLAKYMSGESVLLNGKGKFQSHWLMIPYLPWAAMSSLIIVFGVLDRLRPRLAGYITSRRLRRNSIRSLGKGELCPSCGYDLRFTSERCPECGLAFERRTIIVASGGDALKAPAGTA